jgi:hypothetical protein
MPSLIDETREWLDRAEQAWEVAGQLTDRGAKQAVLQLAESYERLARPAANPAVFRRRELARKRQEGNSWFHSPVATQNSKCDFGRISENGSTSRPTNARRTRQDHRATTRAEKRFGGRTKVIKIVIDNEGDKALSPEAEELLRRRAAEVGFSTLDWIAQLLELHAEQDEEDEPEDEK